MPLDSQINQAPNTSKVNFRRIFIMAIPVLLANIAMPLQGLVDLGLMARLGQASLLAGLGLATQMMAVVLISFNFLQYSSSGLSAQAYGKKGITVELINIIWPALLIASSLGLVMFFLKGHLTKLGLYLLSASDGAGSFALVYLDVRFYGLAAELCHYVFLGFFAGLGRTKLLLLIQSFIAVSNILISLILVEIFHLGILGVAVGTVIAQWLGLSLAAYLFFRTLNIAPKDLLTKLQPLSWQGLISLLSLNKDIFIRTLLLTLSFAWLTRLSAGHGDVILAANMLLLQVLSLSAYALDGVAVATESLGGQALGNKNKVQLRLVLQYTGISIFVLAGILSLLWWLAMPTYLSALAKNAQILTMANQFAIYAILLPLVGAGAYWLDGLYFGMTAGKQIRQAALLVGFLFFLVSYILHTTLNLTGIWLSVLLLLLLRFIILAILLPRLIEEKFG